MRSSMSKYSLKLGAITTGLLLQAQLPPHAIFFQFCFHPLSPQPAYKAPALQAAMGRAAPCCQPSRKLHCSVMRCLMH